MTTFDELADDLYTVPPSEFVAARDSAVAQARAAGDRDLASRLKALRRPNVTAWVVNELARTEPGLVAGLLAVGPALREATTAGDGAALRDLTGHRRTLVAELVAAGRLVASSQGQSFTAATERELETTFTAATIDEDAAAAVASRRLLAGIEVVGMGFGPGAVPPPRVEDREAVAATPLPSTSPADPRVEPSSEASDDELELAAARLQEADAADALEGAEEAVADAVEAEATAAAALREAKARLADARADLTAAKADVAAARRSVRAALDRLGRAED